MDIIIPDIKEMRCVVVSVSFFGPDLCSSFSGFYLTEIIVNMKE